MKFAADGSFSGFSGEQFALPEAVARLRALRRQEGLGTWVSVSGADPLNLVGIIIPGLKLPALTGNRLLYRDGIAIALLTGGEVQFLEDLDTASAWEAGNALLRSPVPPPLVHLSWNCPTRTASQFCAQQATGANRDVSVA